ncbi:hypothetical protein A0U93_14550 [Neoasaia chiangmaiensis]|uniref:Uncharacterized protein n=1 Tax=Neoasaia chiangmaiensis TaxID=320497 RepID=A0A1U9KSW3_9PROT|nr:hypothetical protein A0U93_14550 [Neoasaia chiangmaiensis]
MGRFFLFFHLRHFNIDFKHGAAVATAVELDLHLILIHRYMTLDDFQNFLMELGDKIRVTNSRGTLMGQQYL